MDKEQNAFLDKCLLVLGVLGASMFVIGFLLDPLSVVERFRFLFFGY
ncbi:hypothetical protein [Paenibacillus amylolyticus]|nr:hypothetical protein [Paenibacillus amylolyticus]